MKKTFILLLAAVVAMPVLAQTNHQHDNHPSALPEKARGHILTLARTAVRHLLNFRHETPLDDTQRAQVSAVLQKHRPQVHALMKRGRDARRSFEETVKKGGPDSAAARQSAEQMAGVTRDRALLTAKIGSEVRPLLTSGQQRHLEQMRSELLGLVDSALAEKKL